MNQTAMLKCLLVITSFVLLMCCSQQPFFIHCNPSFAPHWWVTLVISKTQIPMSADHMKTVWTKAWSFQVNAMAEGESS
jgi:hypothetical protein